MALKCLLQKKRIPGFSKFKRGDIIVFVYPDDPKRDFIKRLIALGGETVEIRDGDIYVDGELVTAVRIKNKRYYNKGEYGQEYKPYVVPEGHIYVLGDNSISSHDSRFWGTVPVENVIGRAEVIYWPLNRVRVLQ